MFVNNGTDERIIKSLPSDVLHKAYRAGLTPVPTYTKGRHPHMQIYNKNLNPDQPSDYHHHSDPLVSDKNNYFNVKTRTTYSLADVTNYYNNLPKDKQTGFKRFIQSNYFVSDGKSRTVDAYRIGWGKYTDARFKYVHKPVIERKLSEADSPPPGIKPICFLYGGGSASGKSTVINSKVAPIIKDTGLRFANLDCDELKNDIPEYDLFKKENAGSAAGRVHRESSDLCNECIDAMIKNKKCFTFDGVMGDAERYEALVDRLNRAGYDVHVVAVDIPTDMAVERASKRERQIDEHIIRGAHADFAQAFPQIMELPVSSFSLYDNSQPEGEQPTLIVNSDGVQNQELYNRFLEKGEKEW